MKGDRSGVKMGKVLMGLEKTQQGIIWPNHQFAVAPFFAQKCRLVPQKQNQAILLDCALRPRTPVKC
jgi:hypothetical protein